MQILPLARFSWVPLIAGALLLPAPAQAQLPKSVCESNFRVAQSEGPLFVRDYPSLAAAVVTSVASGSEVLYTVSDRSGAWAEVALPGGQMGWVENRLLGPSPVNSRQFSGSVQIRTLDGGPVNLRAEPAVRANAIALLENGTVLTYLSNEGYWSTVTTADGLSGYVSNLFLVCPAAGPTGS